MKMKKLVTKMYEAILQNDKEKEKKLWLKSLKKSLKHKNTFVIR
jgi:hypothetical protein